jgi:hypothetical protein
MILRIMITSIRRPRIVQDSGQAESRGDRRRARAGSGSVTDKQVVWTSGQTRGLSNNGTASGDSRLKTAGLPPLAVRMWVGP